LKTRVAEPLMHYSAPPIGPGNTPEAARNALPLAFHHWGFHAWAPFVGVFVARISRGRTIRDFVLSVLLVPPVVTLVWFAVFGGTALSMDIHGVSIGEAVAAGNETAEGP
jgi:choline-glycine betaine transporter